MEYDWAFITGVIKGLIKYPSIYLSNVIFPSSRTPCLRLPHTQASSAPTLTARPALITRLWRRSTAGCVTMTTVSCRGHSRLWSSISSRRWTISPTWVCSGCPSSLSADWSIDRPMHCNLFDLSVTCCCCCCCCVSLSSEVLHLHISAQLTTLPPPLWSHVQGVLHVSGATPNNWPTDWQGTYTLSHTHTLIYTHTLTHT